MVTLNSQGLGSFQYMGTPSRGVMSGKWRHVGSKEECVPMDFSGGHGHRGRDAWVWPFLFELHIWGTSAASTT